MLVLIHLSCQVDAHHRGGHLQGVVEDTGPAAQCRAVLRPQHGPRQPVTTPLPLALSKHFKGKSRHETRVDPTRYNLKRGRLAFSG